MGMTSGEENGGRSVPTANEGVGDFTATVSEVSNSVDDSAQYVPHSSKHIKILVILGINFKRKLNFVHKMRMENST